MRSDFFRSVPGFDNDKALRLLGRSQFPQLFQMCRAADGQRYFRFLSDTFRPLPETPLYTRFIEKIGQITPLRVVTTNIDEAMEQRLASAAVFQRSDFPRCVQLLCSDNSFIAKLHGSRSAVESAVFAADDYERLTTDVGYVDALRVLFATASVVFLGYGVQDEYVIHLLTRNAEANWLFGAGPHFVVSSEPRMPLGSIRRIGYELHRHPDHRAAVCVLDYILQLIKSAEEKAQVAVEIPTTAPAHSVSPARTGYFISDLKPPGTWTTYQTVSFADKVTGQPAGEFIVGLGFTNTEVPFRESTALHDLIVGMICFDHVFLPAAALAPALLMLGSEMFWELVRTDMLRLIHMEQDIVALFPTGEVLGTVELVTPRDKDGTGPRPVGEYIRRQIKPAPGKESGAEGLFEDLEKRVTIFSEEASAGAPSLVRGSFLMPRVAGLLGLGEAITPTQVPRWLAFPVLRMAHLIHVRLVCDSLGIQAAKIPFGGPQLATAAFGIQVASELAEHYASYVISGTFNTDVGALVFQQPGILRDIARFRETQEGGSFRREVRDKLLGDGGAEFNAAIDAGLRRNIPLPILQKARDRLSSLLTARPLATPTPAVWGNSRNSDDTTAFWRARSRSLLLALCKERGIGKDDPCICGSGDSLRQCCLAPLRT
jgi:hypothetical protein